MQSSPLNQRRRPGRGAPVAQDGRLPAASTQARLSSLRIENALAAPAPTVQRMHSDRPTVTVGSRSPENKESVDLRAKSSRRHRQWQGGEPQATGAAHSVQAQTILPAATAPFPNRDWPVNDSPRLPAVHAGSVQARR